MIKVVFLNIVHYDGDAIINAANKYLSFGGGVCGEIFESAGYIELTKLCKEIGYCDVGKAVITPGFSLKTEYIIHAVGPRYGVDNPSDKLLQSAYENTFDLAIKHNIKKIALPFISSGIYGYPKDEARRIAIEVAKRYESHFDEIVFATIDKRVVEECKKYL